MEVLRFIQAQQGFCHINTGLDALLDVLVIWHRPLHKIQLTSCVEKHIRRKKCKSRADNDVDSAGNCGSYTSFFFFLRSREQKAVILFL